MADIGLAVCFYRLFPDASSVKQITGDTLSATELPNPRDTPDQYEAYKKRIDGQEMPIITMAAIKHLAEVFDAWESGSEKGVGRKAVLTDLMGRTFEISCQLGEVSDALDKRVKTGSDTRRSAHQPPEEVFRAKLIAHYGLPWAEKDGQVPDAVHDYMPLSVTYLPLLRNIDTKEVYRTEPWGDTANWTIARFRDEFHASATNWKESSALLRVVKETLKRRDLTRIGKIIFFAGYTMQRTDTQRQIFNQHGLVTLLARFIKEQTGGQDVKLFAQDPIYGDQDKAFLGSEGFTVLEDPRGVLEVDESCFVVEIGSYKMQRVVADVARPAGMIWCNMQGGDFATARTKKLATEYNAIKLPPEEEIENTAGGLWLYTRKDIREVEVSSDEDDVKLVV